MDTLKPFSFWRSALGLGMALVVFFVVWVVGAYAFKLLDTVRGLGDDKLQAVFREVVMPGIAGYIAMASTSAAIPAAAPRFVFFGFSAIVLVCVGVYLGMVGPIANHINVTAWDILLAVASLTAAIVGACI